MTNETQTLSTPSGETSPVVTGTGTRPAIIADATAQHGGTIPVQTRNERFTSTDVADFPAVTGREAGWKLTPVDRLGELLDGELDGGRYEFTVQGDGASTAGWTARADARVGTAGIPEDRASANAWSHFTEALDIRVTGEEYTRVTVRRDRFGDTPRAAHTIVEAAPFARGVVVLDNAGAARLAENVEVLVGDGADLTLVTLQDWDDDAVHVATHFARVGRDARLKHVVVSLGGSVVRVNPAVTLAGSGADGELLGVYFADAGQHLESQVFLFHQADHTKGRVEYRGALQGEGAHTVWIGDVLIGRDAVATDSYEQNRNLVLTDGTRADSVPNLEIETGDIEGAGHASATGRFDDEQLFYLQARGITEEQARRLVVRGFLESIVQKIGVPELQSRVSAAIEAELAGGVR
ncbi:Fe-S cluster assembly protein SufD [Amnibacterium sp. CER49]|uniref:Fe-S cluster assembly protein SufD n=1 Tax=Amnibacterium sp. CER49 TaxID=3039161 RepID=UPI00244B8435|nr:Fe-S cluster assembly protein SufD [Amnibacterium sp. CER49]MDH2444425.1 Fe-S cluster assembly protein SufD [Amnibacterium sp. CER49]